MKTYYINLPFTDEDLKILRSGDLVYLSGSILCARDAAHKKMFLELSNNTFDVNLKNEVIYYVGPTPQHSNLIIGSAGPTTSARMDKYTPKLNELGVVATIGKGDRSKEVIDSCIKNKSLYLVATGGAGALLSQKIISYETIRYHDLATESMKRMVVKDFPLYVAYDIYGNDIFNIESEEL